MTRILYRVDFNNVLTCSQEHNVGLKIEKMDGAVNTKKCDY